ncbi:MAG: TadE family protein, partial [Acidimicrobiia bacterium]
MKRPTRSDSGAVAVEAALMMPLITLLFLGIVEFGLLMRDAITTTSASRVGARTAAAHSREPTYVNLAIARVKESVDILGSTEVLVAIYKADSNGFPSGATTDSQIWTNCSTDCVQYSIVNGTITRIGGTEWPANASG